MIDPRISNPLGIAIIIIGSIIALLFSAQQYVLAHRDPKEPPFIAPRIPLIGHLISELTEGPQFFRRLNEKYAYPIFTLPSFITYRLHIVSSPALISQIQRNPKTLSFEHLIPSLTKRMTIADPGTIALYKRDIDTHDPSQNLVYAMHSQQTISLGPGPHLDDMSDIQLREMVKMVNSDIPHSGTVLTTGLFECLRKLMTWSNMLATYGPNHVIALNPSLFADFWEYDRGLPKLMLRIAPWLITPKTYRAQKRLSEALCDWVDKGYWKEASPWIQSRIRLSLERDLTPTMTGPVELGMMFGILANAMPTMFWVISHIFMHPDLLHDIRTELENTDGVVRIRSNGERVISSSGLKAKAPLLNSLFREVLRMYAPMSSVRLVLEDTIIADQYLLKKGSIVRVPGAAVHSNARIWGSDVAEFNPRRFEKSLNGIFIENGPAVAGKKEKQVHPSAFRGFGGGSSMCPGRYFAQMEILGFTAMLVLGYEFGPVEGDKLVLPKPLEATLPLTVTKPEKDFMVNIRLREGLESVKWAFEK